MKKSILLFVVSVILTLVLTPTISGYEIRNEKNSFLDTTPMVTNSYEATDGVNNYVCFTLMMLSEELEYMIYPVI